MIQCLALSLFLLQVPDLPTAVPDYNPNCAWHQIGIATDGPLSFSLYASKLVADPAEPIWIKATITNMTKKKLWLPVCGDEGTTLMRASFSAHQDDLPKNAFPRGAWGVERRPTSRGNLYLTGEDKFFGLEPGKETLFSYECVDGYFLSGSREAGAEEDHTRREYKEGSLTIGLLYRIHNHFFKYKPGDPVYERNHFLRMMEWKGRTAQWIKGAPKGTWEVKGTVRIAKKT
jgi:hypothetical protein